MPGGKSWRKKVEHLSNFLNFCNFRDFFPFLTFIGCTFGVDLEVPVYFLGYSNVYLCCMNAKNDNSYQHNYILEGLHTALDNWFWRILTIFAIFAYLIAQFWSKMGTSRTRVDQNFFHCFQDIMNNLEPEFRDDFPPAT